MFAGIYAQKLGDGALAEFAYCFSPFVEETSGNTVVVDVEGCALRFGSAYELATVIAQQAQVPAKIGGLECEVNVALAANPDVAIHAAKFCRGITYTAPGEELTCIGSLPLRALEYSLINIETKIAEEIFETLRLWGVQTFAQFAVLPVAGVSERLGQEGVKLQQLAAGKTVRHLKLKTAAPVFENAIELDYPIAELEPLSFIFARLLNQICASLQAYAFATNELHVRLTLENKSTHELSLTLPHPMRDHKVFLKLLLLDAERNPPSCAVVAVAIHSEPVKPRVLQTGLFIPLAPEPAKLELTLARLAKLVGFENVGSPQLLDTHRPDAYRVTRFVMKERRRRKSKQQTVNSKQLTVNSEQPAVRIQDSRFVSPNSRFQISNSQVAISNSKSEIRNPKFGFRRFRPPLRAIVEAGCGYPTEINAWGKDRSVYGKVVGLAGPWRASGEWWRPDLWARDEWDVAIEVRGQTADSRRQTTDGRRQMAEWGIKASPIGPSPIIYRIYRELKNGAWFVEGIYD